VAYYIIKFNEGKPRLLTPMNITDSTTGKVDWNWYQPAHRSNQGALAESTSGCKHKHRKEKQQ